MMKLTALKVDPEFQGKIPPLTFEELEQLEKNIVNDGKVINPIIVWNGLIVDGHNRYAILQKHPDISYTGITPAYAGKRLKRSHSIGHFSCILRLFHSVLHRASASGGSRAGPCAPPCLPAQNAVPV